MDREEDIGRRDEKTPEAIALTNPPSRSVSSTSRSWCGK